MPNLLNQRVIGTGALRDRRQHLGVDAATGDVQLELSLGQLGQLADHARQGHLADAVLARPVQRVSGELAHLHEGHVGQRREPRARIRFAAPAGAEHQVGDAVGSRDVDRLLHTRPPRRRGERLDDPRGAEDAGHGDDDLHAPPGRLVRQRLGHRRLDHRAWDRVDGRAADRQAQARLGDHADADAAVQAQSLPGRQPGHRRGEVRAVGDVGVVAGVLDHHGARPALAARRLGDVEGVLEARGQRDGGGVAWSAVDQVEAGGARRSRAAGAGGEAGAQPTFASRCRRVALLVGAGCAANGLGESARRGHSRAHALRAAAATAEPPRVPRTVM